MLAKVFIGWWEEVGLSQGMNTGVSEVQYYRPVGQQCQTWRWVLLNTAALPRTTCHQTCTAPVILDLCSIKGRARNAKVYFNRLRSGVQGDKKRLPISLPTTHLSLPPTCYRVTVLMSVSFITVWEINKGRCGGSTQNSLIKQSLFWVGT